jgi:hypothetical protein
MVWMLSSRADLPGLIDHWSEMGGQSALEFSSWVWSWYAICYAYVLRSWLDSVCPSISLFSVIYSVQPTEKRTYKITTFT